MGRTRGRLCHVRHTVTLFGSILALAAASIASAAPTCTSTTPALGDTVTCTWNSGGNTVITLPVGGGSIDAVLLGAGGAGGAEVSSPGAAGGNGARVDASLSLAGPSYITVVVGEGAGVVDSGSGRGGTFSAIYTGVTATASQVVAVAGGGGGGAAANGAGPKGGSGSAGATAAGGDGINFNGSLLGGSGGASGSGGAGGGGCSGNTLAGSSWAAGGAGAARYGVGGFGGAGYGGGGGGCGSGGGAGGSYVDDTYRIGTVTYAPTGGAGGAGGSPGNGSPGTNGSLSFTVVARTHTVAYNANGATGGSVPTDGSSPYSYGSSATVLGNTGALTRTGYVFAGWNSAADGSGTAYAQGQVISSIAADTVLYAQWTTASHTITYNANGATGGSVPADGSSPYSYGSSATVLGNTGALTRSGYSFAGWNTAADGSGSAYAEGQVVSSITANIVLYAQWTAVPAPTPPTPGPTVTPTNAPRQDPPGHRVTICHRNQGIKMYVEITVDVHSIQGQNQVFGQNGHDQHQNRQDIIPPFQYTDKQGRTWNYPGLNYEEKLPWMNDVRGKVLLANGCQPLRDTSPAAALTTPLPPKTYVTICHWRQNGTYERLTRLPTTEATRDHGTHAKDIIPPWKGYPGKNWNSTSQAIYANGCKPLPIEKGPAPQRALVSFCAALPSGGYARTTLTVAEVLRRDPGNGDIIAPFPYEESNTKKQFPGRNWSNANRALLESGCVPPSPVTATTQLPIDPQVSCVTRNNDGTYNATFGYVNPNPGVVDIAGGPANRIVEAPQGPYSELRGQTIRFESGERTQSFTIENIPNTQTVTWTVAYHGTRSATANQLFPVPCMATLPVPLTEGQAQARELGVFVSCVAVGGSTYRATFGFVNPTPQSMTIRAGKRNRIVGSKRFDHGQPATFTPGTAEAAFTVRGIRRGDSRRWEITLPDGQVVGATAYDNAPRCAATTRIPNLSVPVPGATGSTAATSSTADAQPSLSASITTPRQVTIGTGNIAVAGEHARSASSSPRSKMRTIVTVTNTGRDPAYRVVVDVPTPRTTSRFTAVPSPTGGTCTVRAARMRCTFHSLMPGATRRFALTSIARIPGTVYPAVRAAAASASGATGVTANSSVLTITR